MEPEPRFLGKKQLEPGANQLLTSGSNPGYPELSWNRVRFLESEQNKNWILFLFFLKNQRSLIFGIRTEPELDFVFLFFEKPDQELDS